MTGSPADQPEAAQEAASGAEQAEQGTANDALVEQTAAWLGQIASASGELARLFRLEWQLTLGDAKRVLLLGVLLVPLLLFAWLMLSALVGWAVWYAAGSVGLALAAMLALQLVCIAGLVRQIGIYQRSQGFRRTRAHLKRLLQGAGDEKAATDSGD
ncbi:hypothetical protein [Halopseudomonas maritima]|uniref:hypothetical protein n=1 Tax=Halopseudomonas maritima TaxID=2918528 RepID=UPI001EEABF51|nr:hypothetical protein [Halopseudomonas maritima]UJJ32631.1 hypothetical protein HV822_05595 [Halopseudomonas maritima]